ncbi:hypothetical protein V1512DRAFT_249388 [Lipomyces arxii]|uniref:uncharacterized protein n=1 Tax=Lipomyces arxii TaxID=56418 RepID=UPI0034CF07E4
MSGGKRYPFPKHVWAPTGGWWPNPKNWRTNFFGVWASLIGFGLFLKVAGPQIAQPKLNSKVAEELTANFNAAAKQGRSA